MRCSATACSGTVPNINPEDHSYTTKERRTVSADRELHATKEDFERQINQLAAILQIKHTNSFILGISIHVHHAQSSEKYQEFLVPLVYDLKVRGFDLRLTFYLPRPFKAADFTSAYDKPRAEWDEQIRKKSVFITQQNE
ncbi:hypothetical protein CC86DRAFT_43227 [Ophiobolus disseminans]|uniref:Uncharacterized protein n=1 Tax=Ophiobolus disseminans TaxID=1469910 RepID=A0A6A6ZWK3_9PLEO|nr:hypothetical protein CC86DRAFT_43227 [Ophiobolus disseminans]